MANERIKKIDKNLARVRELKEYFGDSLNLLETRLEQMRAEEADKIGREKKS